MQQFSVNEAETDLKDAQIASLLAIHEMTQASSNSTRTNRKEPGIQKDNR
jgi:hypothetical protein